MRGEAQERGVRDLDQNVVHTYGCSHGHSSGQLINGKPKSRQPSGEQQTRNEGVTPTSNAKDRQDKQRKAQERKAGRTVDVHVLHTAPANHAQATENEVQNQIAKSPARLQRERERAKTDKDAAAQRSRTFSYPRSRLPASAPRTRRRCHLETAQPAHTHADTDRPTHTQVHRRAGHRIWHRAQLKTNRTQSIRQKHKGPTFDLVCSMILPAGVSAGSSPWKTTSDRIDWLIKTNSQALKDSELKAETRIRERERRKNTPDRKNRHLSPRAQSGSAP